VTRTLAFIPARAGSKRIPGKNLCEVGGLSLVARAVDSAPPGLVLVSTDDPGVVISMSWRIAEGRCSIHARKPEHATDDAQIESAIADALRDVRRLGFDVDAIVLLQPTSPFRTSVHVSEALELLTPGFDSVVSVTRDPGYRFMGRTTTEGSYRPYRPDLAERGRSTDELDHRCPVRENGAIYVTRTEAFERTGLRMSGWIAPYLMSARDSWEIDEWWELEAARAIAVKPWRASGDRS
jgi:CMP-N-acetylneuraminic acid synthetase